MDGRAFTGEKSCYLKAVRAKFKAMSEKLVVNEIYLSLQGESTFAGLPCIFIRLTACDLRCSYCDTAYAFTEGKKQTLPDILAEVQRLAVPYAPSRLTPHGSRLTDQITRPSPSPFPPRRRIYSPSRSPD